jgi:hypothetical protein
MGHKTIQVIFYQYIYVFRRVMSTHIYVFKHVYFNVSKTLKFEHTSLKYVTHLAHRVKYIYIYVSILIAYINSTNFK